MHTSPERGGNSPLGRLLLAIATAIATIFIAAGQANIGPGEVRWGIATFGVLAVILLVAEARRAWKSDAVDFRRSDEPTTPIAGSVGEVERGSPTQLESGPDEGIGLGVDRDT